MTENSGAFFGSVDVPKIENEPFKYYPKDSEERRKLLAECKRIRSLGEQEVPIVINGKRYYTDNKIAFTMPSDNKTPFFKLNIADDKLVKQAVEGSLEAQRKWMEISHDQRASIFLNLAHILATKRRDILNAITMLNLGKTMWEAEIDIVEMIDFFRFNAWYMLRMYKTQPLHHSKGVWNKLEFRPLEGFIAALSPFNFISLHAQICAVPTVLGNVSFWRPCKSTSLASYYLFELFEEAGIPPGVINFVPCGHKDFSDLVLKHPKMAGFHFTGSTGTFNHLWKVISSNIQNYHNYPKIVGETGGKNFHLLHESGNIENFIATSVRGAFDYSGQKCSATSRMYVPKSKWEEVGKKLIDAIQKFCVLGQPDEAKSYCTAVIDEKSYNNIIGFIERAKDDPDVKILVGGKGDNSKGWFVEPTVLLTKNPKSETMVNEIFGPVLTIYVYDDYEKVLDLVDTTTQYALTGSVFAMDRYIITKTMKRLRYAAGNFYINDKCTGAVCGQQFFGGARKSGTNDKNGSPMGLFRWVTPRTIKEQFNFIDSPGYPSTIPDDEKKE